MKIIIINGPNLNLQGKRKCDTYGTTDFDTLLRELKTRYPADSITLVQSNIEGEIVTLLQQSDESYDGIILNAGGYTHTSVAIRDAVEAISTPVVEVHISQIYAREEFRHTSLLSAVARGTISGFGVDSYRLGIEALKQICEAY